MSLRRFHPHGVQHTFNRSDQLPPATGTLRLYVDGTAGNDAAAGTSWATAWRTAGRFFDAVNALLFVEPNGLTIEGFARGTIAAATLFAKVALHGNSRFYFGQHIDDMTSIRNGTIAAVGGEAPVPDHGMERFTLSVAPAATDVGRILLLTDPVSGTNRGTCTINRVDTVNNYVWVSQLIGEFPAWVAASPANFDILEPGAYVDGGLMVHLETTVGDGLSTLASRPSVLIGIRTANRCHVFGDGVALVGCLIQSTALAWNLLTFQSGRMQYSGYGRYGAAGQYVFPDAIAQDYGIIGGATPVDQNTLGNGADSLYARTGSDVSCFGGYFVTSLSMDRNGSYCTAQRFHAGTVYVASQNWCDATNYTATGTATGFANQATLGGMLKPSRFSLVNVPTTGISAIFCATRRGFIRVSDAFVEGDNTGTSADRYGALAQTDGMILFEGAVDDNFKAKTNRFRADGGRIAFGSTLAMASSEGSGADIYVGPGSVLDLANNVTKSAVNSETAIQNGVDGQIVAAGTQFIAASAVFTAAHVGRSVKVSGAVNPANNAVHLITAYTNPTTVVLGASAGLVNEGPGLTWGLVGTPAPILEVARGGRVSQASGKTFNVRKPEVDPDTAVQEWGNYGYGVNGAIYEHENAEVTLGTVVEAAGAAGATGLAAKIKNGSKLVHTGGAVLLGVAPLDLGGNAGAIAWPATPSTDLASAAPQMCMVIPNA